MRRRDWIRISRYLDGEATLAERRETDAWLAEDPARRELLDQLRRMHDAAEGSIERSSPAADADWERIAERTTRLDPFRARRIHARTVVRVRPWWLARPSLAAGLLAALVGIGAWLSWARGGVPIPSTAAAVSQTWTTEASETARIALADGSVVHLGPGSTLTGPDAAARRYLLVGTARFQVAPDSLRPFVVETRHGVTRVLGTDFTIQARASDDATTILVEEGRVAVRSTRAAGEVVLDAGESGRAWADAPPVRFGESAGVSIRFDGAPLGTVLRALAAAHGVRIDLADPGLAELRLTTDLTGLSLAQSLEVLEATLDITASVDGTRVRLGTTRDAP